MALGFVISAIVTLASAGFQAFQAKRARAKQKRAADKNKGIEFSAKGESIPLNVVYGRPGFVAGGVTYWNLSKNYTYGANQPQASTAAGDRFAVGNSLVDYYYNEGAGTSDTDKQNNRLFFQQAICMGGINRVITARIDDRHIDEKVLKVSRRHHVRTGNTYATADPLLLDNRGEDDDVINNRFKNIASATSMLKINRDDPQYSGIPDVLYLVEGMKVRTVIKSGDNYSLSSTRTYSSSPALCLLDYLLSPVYGKGLPLSKLDLKSFYDANIVCNKVVRTSASFTSYAAYYLDPNYTIRDTEAEIMAPLPLYSCDLTLSTEDDVKENVVKILETMNDADLIWSQGKYKLVVDYPETEEEQNDLVVFDITDDNIIKDSFKKVYPSLDDRLNQATVKFYNGNKKFEEDTVTWPEADNPVYSIYLEQDNGIPLKEDFPGDGAVNPYHAKAKAEYLVRMSRGVIKFEFTLSKRAIVLEPGDLVRFNSVVHNLNMVMRIEEVEVSEDLTVKIKAARFDWRMLAWNVADNKPGIGFPSIDTSVPPPTNVVFNPSGTKRVRSFSSGLLTWEEPDDGVVTSFIVSISSDNGVSFEFLGETSAERYEVTGLQGGFYVFGVQSKTRSGALSNRVTTGTAPANVPRFRIGTPDIEPGSIDRESLNPTLQEEIEGMLQLANDAVDAAERANTAADEARDLIANLDEEFLAGALEELQDIKDVLGDYDLQGAREQSLRAIRKNGFLPDPAFHKWNNDNTLLDSAFWTTNGQSRITRNLTDGFYGSGAVMNSPAGNAGTAVIASTPNQIKTDPNIGAVYLSCMLEYVSGDLASGAARASWVRASDNISVIGSFQKEGTSGGQLDLLGFRPLVGVLQEKHFLIRKPFEGASSAFSISLFGKFTTRNNPLHIKIHFLSVREATEEELRASEALDADAVISQVNQTLEGVDFVSAAQLETVRVTANRADGAITTFKGAYATADAVVTEAQTRVNATAPFVRTFRQSMTPSVPAGGHRAGDLWFDLSRNRRLFRWSGTDWVETDDDRVGGLVADVDVIQRARADEAIALAEYKTEVVASINGKAKTFRSDTAPNRNTTPLFPGDLWINTSQNNRLSYYTGTQWVRADDERVGSMSSTVTTTSQAVTGINGKLAAAYVARVRAGGGAATFEMIAADDVTNASAQASTIRFSADNILLRGSVAASSLVVGDFYNLNLDPDYEDPNWWSTNDQWIIQSSASGSELGTKGLVFSSPTNPTETTVRTASGFIKLSPVPTTIALKVRHSGSGASVRGRAVMAYYNDAKEHIGWSHWTNQSPLTTGAGGIFFLTANWTPMEGTAYGRIRFEATAGTGRVDFGEVIVRKQIQGVYIADGAITADKAYFTSLSALNLKVKSGEVDDLAIGTANIRNANITNAKIDNLAVSTSKLGNAAVSNINTSASIGTMTISTSGGVVHIFAPVTTSFSTVGSNSASATVRIEYKLTSDSEWTNLATDQSTVSPSLQPNGTWQGAIARARLDVATFVSNGGSYQIRRRMNLSGGGEGIFSGPMSTLELKK